MNEQPAVVISDGRSEVKLVPVGAPGVGFPTRLEVSSGPFSVAIEAEARSYAAFCESLATLHKNLTGEARLEFWNEEHCLVLRGNGRGSIEVMLNVTDSRTPWFARLTVKMFLDQSYLPTIIHDIRESFARSS
jgi:hypothetical protein